MKKIFSYISMALLLVAGVSCNKMKHEAASLVLSVSELDVSPEGETTTIGVKSNRDWVATVDSDWIRLTPSSAEAFEASSYMILEAEANESYDRTAVITVSSKSGDVSAMVEVYQGEDGLMIKDVDQFVTYLEAVAAGEIPQEDTYKLAEDIELGDVVLPEIAEFNNSFDGRGHYLTNWTPDITKPLFKKIGATGVLSNLCIDASCTLEVPAFTGKVGFITHVNEGTMEGIVNEADVTVTAMSTAADNTMFGVLCGVNQGAGVVRACENYGTMTYSGAPSSKNVYFAGIVGQTTGENARVEECYNGGEFDFAYNAVAPKAIYVSGIAGALNSNSKILDCTNEGNITVRTKGSSSMVAVVGIVQYAGGEVSGCANSGAISYYAESAENAADGGVQRTGVAGIAAYMGWSGKTASNNHNSGDITFRGGHSVGYAGCGSASKYAVNVAGVFGHAMKCGIDNCSNEGTVTAYFGQIEKSTDNDDTSDGINTSIRQSCGGIVASSWGAITDCYNSGTINASFINSSNADFNKNFVVQVGGISGGDYHSDQKSSNITSCTNEGAINYRCDSSGSNNSMGGIVGWPGKEGEACNKVEDCNNYGKITVEGYGMTRIGGISGGAVAQTGNTNEGEIEIKGCKTNSTVGGVAGVAAAVHPIAGCSNYGAIKSSVKLAGAQGGSSSAIGGIVGASFNQANLTVKGCTAKCDITAPAGSTAFMLVGCCGSNKAVTTKNVFGTNDEPNYVGGSITLGTSTTTLSGSNYLGQAMAAITSNTNISRVINFAE